MPKAFLKAFAMGALKPHASTLLPYFNRPGGRFVEIGARDGLKESFTPYLEKALGWSGLLVEPWPHLFQKCRKVRRSSLTVNVAVVDHSLQDSWIDLVGMPPETSVRQRLRQEAQERSEGRPAQPPVPGRKKDKAIQYISTNSLEGILERSQFNDDFDLLICNLLGFEDHALEGMDFERRKPTYIMIRAMKEKPELPHLPSFYERIAVSPHDRASSLHLFRYADFGKN